MTIEQYIRRELEAFPCRSALLMAEIDSAEILHSIRAEERIVSASTIKVPILLAALDLVDRGVLRLDQRVVIPEQCICADTEVFEAGNRSPQGYPLREILYWMIVSSDNTATNAVIDLLGYEAVNAYCAGLGLADTVLERKMLDWDAVAAGRNNYTSARDQYQIYRLLAQDRILSRTTRAVALDILCRQRCTDGLLRYIPDRITVAHKSGGLDYLNHDAGLFLLERCRYFLGIFTWDGPSPEGDSRQKQLIGRLSKAIYEEYR